MKMKFLLLTLSLVLIYSQPGISKHWAVVVAGSNGWYNYRHQADACHAYQVLHKHGIPDENIIVMMYDDIANSRENPTKGKIINKPNGPDVYQGVPKDYTRGEVTPDNFLNVLQGNKDEVNGGSGKVVDSGPDDNIFVFFSDHGAPGLIAFPMDELYAKQLHTAIMNMNEKKRYKKMVFYIEACESGSMFKDLPSNIDVFATTASNGHESSYACYYDKKRRTYLGDVYSVNWMENSDKANFTAETLQQQFALVKKETNTSHVMEFGDLTMSKLVIGSFQGENGFDEITKHTPKVPITDAVPSPDVALHIMYNRLKESKTSKERDHVLEMLMDETKVRHTIRKTVHDVVNRLVLSKSKRHRIINKPAVPQDFHCYRSVVTKFKQACFDFNKYDHALRHIYVLSNLCEESIATVDIHGAIEKACYPLHQQYTK